MRKLNLGCGRDRKTGWINIDIDLRVGPDVVMDLQDYLPLSDETVDQVLAQDVLEHLTKQQAQSFMGQLNRVIKPGGQVEIRVPDLEKIVSAFGQDSEVMFEFIYGNTRENGIWGVHKYAYTKETLARLLRSYGFEVTLAESETTNIRLVARKRRINPRVKLLVIQQSPAWGGAEEWMAQVVENLIEKHQVEVISVTNHPKLLNLWQESGAKVEKLPGAIDIIGNLKGLLKALVTIWPLTLYYFGLLQRAKKSGVNVILMSGFSEKLLVSWIAWIYDIPVVWYEYGPLDQVFKKNFQLPKLLYRLTKNIPRYVITLSRHTLNQLIPSTRLSLAKLVEISPGVLPSKGNYSPSGPVVGTLSRLVEEKSLVEFVQAWRLVVNQLPEAKLLMAGDGPLSESLKNLIAKLKLESNIELVGFVADKGEFYRQLRVFVQPSRWELEGFGLVLIEALGQGVPVIAFDRGPGNQVLSQAGGVLVEDGNYLQLASQIVKLLEQPSACRQIGSQGKQMVERHYDLKTQIDRLHDLLERTVWEQA